MNLKFDSWESQANRTPTVIELSFQNIFSISLSDNNEKKYLILIISIRFLRYFYLGYLDFVYLKWYWLNIFFYQVEFVFWNSYLVIVF